MRLLVASLLLSSFAFAQTSPEPAPKPSKVQKIEFEPDEIAGGIVGPTGLVVVEPPPRKFNSLIRMRTDFNDKLRESVHEM